MDNKQNVSAETEDLPEKVDKLTDKVDSVAVGITDLTEAVNNFATKVDQRFERVDQRFGGIEQRLTKIEATMVTKDYLDEKLADLRGDLVILMRKEDTKLKTLIDVLCNRKVISDEDKNRILSMEPFPLLS